MKASGGKQVEDLLDGFGLMWLRHVAQIGFWGFPAAGILFAYCSSETEPAMIISSLGFQLTGGDDLPPPARVPQAGSLCNSSRRGQSWTPITPLLG